MKFSTTFVSLALLATLVAAAPAAPQASKQAVAKAAGKDQANKDQANKNKAKGNAAQGNAGAAYFMTNEAEANFIVVADIKADGSLALNRAVATGGRGLAGTPDADGLFSQGCIKASKNGEILVAVNPGSNTISSFSINKENPAELTKLGEVVSSEGEFPMSLALNKAGNLVCALNGGEVSNVQCFKADKKQGLTAVQGSLRALDLKQTTPAKGPANTASHILFSEDETKLIASIKGNPAKPGFLAIWDVGKDGKLSAQFAKVSPPKGGALPFGMSIIPGKNAALVTDPALGFDIFDLSAGGITKGKTVAAAGKSSTVKVDGQGAVCWSSRSQKTGNFYLTDIATAKVTEVNVDNNLKATVVKQYQQGKDSGTIDTDIATVNGNDFLYVLGANKTVISVLSLNAPGKATQKQDLDLAAPAKAAGLKLGKSIQGMTTFTK